MPKYDLTDFTKGQICAYRDGGMSYGKIGAKLSLPKSTVSSFYKKFENAGKVLRHDRERCGRHRISGAPTNMMIKSYSTDYSFASLSEIRSHLNSAVGRSLGPIPSTATISRRLKSFGLPCRSPARKCFLTETCKLARLLWAREHVNWDDEWRQVIFTDESTVTVNKKWNQFVRRPPGKRYDTNYVTGKQNKSLGSVNIWAAISWRGVSILHIINGRLTARKYIDEILSVALKDYCTENFIDNEFIIQQDNCPCHTAMIVKNYFREHQLRILDWPSNSPDISPIENVWADAKRHLSSSNVILNKESMQNELFRFFAEYNGTRLFFIRNLIASMKDRCQSLIDNDGDYLKY